MNDSFQAGYTGETSSAPLLATERWSVRKSKSKFDAEFETFHEIELAKIDQYRDSSNKKAVDLVQRIFLKMRWSSPEWPSNTQRLIIECCHHYLGDTPHEIFPKQGLLDNWNTRAQGTAFEKLSREIQSDIDLLQTTVRQRDERVVASIQTLEKRTEDMRVKYEGKLRWMMETDKGNQKDRFYTAWFFASRGMIDELERFLSNARNKSRTSSRPPSQQSKNLNPNSNSNPAVDERDPDFGLTALHYACKRGDLKIMHMLLQHGADENARAPDGRTPLHFAAAYGSKEMLLELLARGVDYDAKDNYGCSALDLAGQNKNKLTLKTLLNWPLLIPKEKAPTPPPEIDWSAVPEECRGFTEDVKAKMSPTLRLLTIRLETIASGAQRGESVNVPVDPTVGVLNQSVSDPLVEMRLCEKHSVLCFREGLLDPGMRSLRRRWLVARKILTTSAVETAGVDVSAPTNTDVPGTATTAAFPDLAKVISSSSSSIPAEATSRRDSLSVTAVVEIGRDLAERYIKLQCEGFAAVLLAQCCGIFEGHKGLPPLTSTFKKTFSRGPADRPPSAHFREQFGLIAAMSGEDEKSELDGDIERLISNATTAPPAPSEGVVDQEERLQEKDQDQDQVHQSAAAAAAEELHSEDIDKLLARFMKSLSSTEIVTSTSTTSAVGGAQKSRQGVKSIPFNGHNNDSNNSDPKEGDGSTRRHRVVTAPDDILAEQVAKDPSTAYLHMNVLVRRCETLLCVHDTLAASNGIESIRTLPTAPNLESYPPVAANKTTSAMNINNALKPASAISPEPSMILPGSSFMHGSNLIPGSILAAGSSLDLGSTSTFLNTPIPGSVAASVELGQSHVSTAAATAGGSSILPTIVPASSAVFGGVGIQRISGTNNNPMWTTCPRLKHLMMECLDCARKAIKIHFSLNSTTYFEPITLSPLLELMANAQERLGTLKDCVQTMQHAEIVNARILGDAHKDTIRVSLQLLRVSIKACESSEDFQRVSRMSALASRRLQQLSESDPHEAEQMVHQCVELISLSRLLEEEGKAPLNDKNQARNRIREKPKSIYGVDVEFDGVLVPKRSRANVTSGGKKKKAPTIRGGFLPTITTNTNATVTIRHSQSNY